MQIRRATGREMLALWGYQELNAASPTAKFFYNSITAGNAAFWTLDRDGELIAELKEMGFRYVTIGVGSDEPQNYRLYQRYGFHTKIKDCHYDPCGMDENMQPVYEDTVWWLLQKVL